MTGDKIPYYDRPDVVLSDTWLEYWGEEPRRFDEAGVPPPKAKPEAEEPMEEVGLCEGCYVYPAEADGGLCPGCLAYEEHQT